mmetsp:Transcript_3238/g.5084  ORF Transcript_3238/g.5084 Transcript_3238/m.5084 type:complete len:90 (+) Transcript_3238:615-884(+)
MGGSAKYGIASSNPEWQKIQTRYYQSNDRHTSTVVITTEVDTKAGQRNKKTSIITALRSDDEMQEAGRKFTIKFINARRGTRESISTTV